VQQTARLTHPNTITIYDYGRTPDGVFYYAMELLDGASLQTIVELDGPQPPPRVARVLSMVAAGLSEAHELGLVHRDIKPGNTFLCRQGGEFDVAKVLDFGLVKVVEDGWDPGITRDGVISGTPLYLAPEALTHPDAVDARSDLYALGAVGYYLLTGEHVFTGTIPEVCGHHLHTAPTPPSERLGRELPPELEALVMQCLAKDPSERPASAAETRDRLTAMDGVDGWGQAEARAWWEERGATLGPESAETAMESTRVLAVDPDQLR
jgi:serine/threonine protein kinase